MIPVFILFPAFVLAGLLFGWPPRRSWLKIGALAVLPPLAHWGESIVVGGAHHLMPIFVFVFAALVYQLALSEPRPSTGRRGLWLATAVLLFYVALCLRTNAPNLPANCKSQFYRAIGKPVLAVHNDLARRIEAPSDRALIAAVNALPAEASVALWTNGRATGHLANRADLWLFPDNYDLTDYLVIQRDAPDICFAYDPSAAANLRDAILKGDIPGWTPITETMIAPVVHQLVEQNGSHVVLADTPHYLLLRRMQHHAFVLPPETMGFGWWRRIPEVPLFRGPPRATPRT